jgi:ATP-dependent DNA ligase
MRYFVHRSQGICLVVSTAFVFSCYHLEAIKSNGAVTIYSRRQNVLTQRFPYIAETLEGPPAGTVIDGELVALGPDGRPDFNLLQNFRSAESRIVYYAFDILIHKDRDLMALSERRPILRSVLEPNVRVALSQVFDRSAAEMLKFVKSHGLEGVIAKRAQ